MKTVFITIPGWFEFRNLFLSDVFDILRSRKDLRIVAFTYPSAYDVFVPPESRGDNIILEDLTMFELNLIENVLRKIEELIFFNIYPSETVKMYEMARKKREYSKYLAFGFAKKVLGKNKNLIVALEKLDMIISKYKYRRFKYLFQKYAPSLVLSTSFLSNYDWGMIKAAKQYKVPVISMVANWDHLCKARLPKCDKVIAWNNFQKNQLIQYYGYNPRDVLIAGIPHQDCFIRAKNKFLPREEFLKKIGAPTDKKLITYTAMSRMASPDQPDIVEIVCNAVKDGKIKYPSHVHVRFHPSSDFDRYEKLKMFGDIITFEKVAEKGRLGEETIIHYANLLSNSDVVVNIASSVTLDAVAFDKPVINIAFDGYTQRALPKSTARYFKYEHYSAVVKTGGVKIAENAEELIRYINMYLDNPALDRDKRRKIFEEQCGELDGKSGERIANFILDFLESGEKSH